LTFKVIQGHWRGAIYDFLLFFSLRLYLCLAPFPKYYQLFPKNSRGHVTMYTSRRATSG